GNAKTPAGRRIGKPPPALSGVALPVGPLAADEFPPILLPLRAAQDLLHIEVRRRLVLAPVLSRTNRLENLNELATFTLGKDDGPCPCVQTVPTPPRVDDLVDIGDVLVTNQLLGLLPS